MEIEHLVQTKYGGLKVADLIGKKFGTKVCYKVGGGKVLCLGKVWIQDPCDEGIGIMVSDTSSGDQVWWLIIGKIRNQVCDKVRVETQVWWPLSGKVWNQGV